MSNHMYRAHIVERPEFERYVAFDDRTGEQRVEWSRPVGWEASPAYIERFHSDKFFEPSTDKWFRSRSSAKARVDLLNEMGYRAIVQRSAPVVWPLGDREKVPQKPKTPNVAQAMRIVRSAGFTVIA